MHVPKTNNPLVQTEELQVRDRRGRISPLITIHSRLMVAELLTYWPATLRRHVRASACATFLRFISQIYTVSKTKKLEMVCLALQEFTVACNVHHRQVKLVLYHKKYIRSYARKLKEKMLTNPHHVGLIT